MTVDYDENALEAQLGQAGSTYEEQDPEELRLHADDLDQLNRIGQSQPAGIKPPEQTPPPAAGAVREYLAPHMPAAPDPTVQPEPAPNYAALYQDHFNKPYEGTGELTLDTFQREVVRDNAYHNFLEQYLVLSELEEIVADKVEPVKLLQNDITQALEKANLYTDSLLDQRLEHFYKDGALTPAGEQRINQLKAQASQDIDAIQTAAAKQADSAEERLTGFYTALSEQASSFKPFGVSLPETMIADMQDDIRTGKVDRWLESSKNGKEAAQKSLLLSLISDPVRWAEYNKLLDQRGYDYGTNRRLAGQFTT